MELINIELTGVVEARRQSNFDDVGDFHEKFDLPNTTHGQIAPTLLDEDLHRFRYKFLREELKELSDAYDAEDLVGCADALVDLVYVAMGTAHLMGLPWQELWDEVQRANMTKIRASTADESARATGRGHASDVLKPANFIPPDIEGVLAKYPWV